jgi:hypothetical protein
LTRCGCGEAATVCTNSCKATMARRMAESNADMASRRNYVLGERKSLHDMAMSQS